MNQQPDKLFNDKLRDLQKPAPAAAWGRIEANLEKKTSRKFLWWQIAASLALFALVGYLTWFHNYNKAQPAITQSEALTAPVFEEQKETAEEVPSTVEEQKQKPAFTSPALPAKTAPNRTKVTTNAKIIKEQVAQALPEPVEEELSPNATAYTPTVKETEEDESPAADKSVPMKFTISAEETDKYLNKLGVAHATSEDQRPSTFKKLLKKANDLKSNQDPFGDLREKKNEILALNFRSDKREQNK